MWTRDISILGKFDNNKNFLYELRRERNRLVPTLCVGTQQDALRPYTGGRRASDLHTPVQSLIAALRRRARNIRRLSVVEGSYNTGRISERYPTLSCVVVT
jgi:hypothetical protein